MNTSSIQERLDNIQIRLEKAERLNAAFGKSKNQWANDYLFDVQFLVLLVLVTKTEEIHAKVQSISQLREDKSKNKEAGKGYGKVGGGVHHKKDSCSKVCARPGKVKREGK